MAIGLALCAAGAACSGGSGGASATPTTAPTTSPTSAPSPSPTPTATPSSGTVPAAASGVFVNAAPDPSGNASKAAAYVGWVASTGPGVTGYVVASSVNGGQPVSALVAHGTAYEATGLPAGASLSVTVTAVNAAGSSAPTAPVVTTLPSSPTAAQDAAYASAAAYSDANSGLAMLAFRDGATVYTHYAAGYADTAQPLASGTKSFNCALEIFAEQDGLLTLADNASSVITEWRASPNESQITILDLLSLQSGLSGTPGYSPGAAPTLDTYQEAVAETDSYAPGQAFIYDPLSFQNFALIFQVKTGGAYGGNGQVSGGTDPVAYLQTKLFTPLGINSNAYAWTRDIDGHPQMAGGASFTATDWLKYGQLVLQHGTWQSSRLLDAAKLQNCTGGYQNPAYLGYGITWWLNAHNDGTYNPSIDQIPPGVVPPAGYDQVAPHAPVDMFMAAGAGNERLYVIPSLNLAVVRLAPVSTAGSPWSDDTFAGKFVGTLP